MLCCKSLEACFRPSLSACREKHQLGAQQLSGSGLMPLTCTGSLHTMRFGSTAKVLLKCKLKYYRISKCSMSTCILSRRYLGCRACAAEAADEANSSHTSGHRYCRVCMSSVNCLYVQQALPKSTILYRARSSRTLRASASSSEALAGQCPSVEGPSKSACAYHLTISKLHGAIFSGFSSSGIPIDWDMLCSQGYAWGA